MRWGSQHQSEPERVAVVGPTSVSGPQSQQPPPRFVERLELSILFECPACGAVRLYRSVYLDLPAHLGEISIRDGFPMCRHEPTDFHRDPRPMVLINSWLLRSTVTA